MRLWTSKSIVQTLSPYPRYTAASYIFKMVYHLSSNSKLPVVLTHRTLSLFLPTRHLEMKLKFWNWDDMLCLGSCFREFRTYLQRPRNILLFDWVYRQSELRKLEFEWSRSCSIIHRHSISVSFWGFDCIAIDWLCVTFKITWAHLGSSDSWHIHRDESHCKVKFHCKMLSSWRHIN